MPYLRDSDLVVAQRIDLFIPCEFRHCVIGQVSQGQKIHFYKVKFTISFWQSLQSNLVSIAMELFTSQAGGT
jgi:hypothetical protein